MRRVWLALGSVVGLLVTGCGAPPPTDELLDDPVVVTRYASGVDFGAFHGFYLRPEIRTLNDDGSVDTVDPSNNKPEKQVKRLNKAVEKMFKNYPPKKKS